MLRVTHRLIWCLVRIFILQRSHVRSFELDSCVTIRGMWQLLDYQSYWWYIGFVSHFGVSQIPVQIDSYRPISTHLPRPTQKLRLNFGLIDVAYDQSRQSSVKLLRKWRWNSISRDILKGYWWMNRLRPSHFPISCHPDTTPIAYYSDLLCILSFF